MAEGKSPEQIYKDETYDFMFAEIVKHDKYKHLLEHMPIAKSPVSTSTVAIKPPVTTGTSTLAKLVAKCTTTSAPPVTTDVHSPVHTTVGTPKLAMPLYTSTPSGNVSEIEDFLKGIAKPPLGSDVKYKPVVPPLKLPPVTESKKDEKSSVLVSSAKEAEKHSVIPSVGYSIDFETPKFPSPTKRKPQNKDSIAPLSRASGLSDATLLDLAKVQIPKLPQFSGTGAKGDASYEVWKFEVACLQKESIYPDAHILQAIRQSLKGEARDTLLTVGESATSKDVLIKLNALYGIASSNESIMQQFYLAHQKASENVAQYSIRLENILQPTKDYVPEKTKNEMLRSKLWSGLRDPQLKNASRFKYELETDFNKLRIAIRQIEQDMLSETVQTASVQQHTVVKDSDSALEEILKRIKAMEGKMEGVDRNIERKIEKKLKDLSLAEANTASTQVEFNRGRGRGYRGRNNNRGRFRNRGRGNRGSSLNESGSTS